MSGVEAEEEAWITVAVENFKPRGVRLPCTLNATRCATDCHAMQSRGSDGGYRAITPLPRDCIARFYFTTITFSNNPFSPA